MRRAVVQLAFFALIILAGYLFFFKRDATVGMLQKGVTQARGYTPAKTPQEAMDKFREAIKGRDYETAAQVYCGGDYAEQMRKAAPAAAKLGGEIDDLLHQMSNKGKKTDRSELVLRMLDPFPTGFEVPDIKTSGDKATAKLVEPIGLKLKFDPTTLGDRWNVDVIVFRALCKSLLPDKTGAVYVDLRQDGKGEEKAWKIYFPVNEDLRLAVDRLNSKHMDYVNALKKVKYEVMHEPQTGRDAEASLKRELEAVAK